MELNIVGNGMNGEGIAKINGKVYFVDGAIFGETVIAKILKENKNFSNAIACKILNRSENRVEPICKYYGSCGGCDLQHMNYKMQLEVKKNNIQSLINKAKLNVNVGDVIVSENEFNYRNKLTLYLTNLNCLGFYKRGSNELIEINECMLVNEKFNKMIQNLNIFFKNNRDFNHFFIKGVSIRQIEDVFILNFIVTKKLNFSKLENFLKLNKFKYSIYFCVNTKSDLPVSPVYFVGGLSEITITELGITYPVFPLSFLQVNNNIKTIIYNKILSLISPKSVVIDAYSGAGLLSSIVSKKAKEVFAIEIEKDATMACEHIIEYNKINNLVAINGDCAIEIPKILETQKIDTIILDPARRGVDNNTLLKIAMAKPKKIIYLSCNPATLIRDLKILCDNEKYKINFVQPYDMFPQTSEVETLVELELE